MEEKISIIVASYNYASYIGEAIESIINQTYNNWELIIIDDASSDNSIEIIEEYLKKDNRIQLHINETNLGLAKTLQKGISLAKGEWIAFLESDDIFTPNSIQEKVNAINTGADIIFSDVEMFQDEEKIVDFQRYFDDLNKLFVKLDTSKFIDNFAKIIPRINVIPTFSCVMVKRKHLLSCKFNPLCKASLDYYLWAQLSNLKIYYINLKLTKWRIHRDSYINKDKNHWLTNYMFKVSLYYQTIKNKNFFIKYLMLINYMRARIIYLKISRKKIKLNLLNDKYIFEKNLG